MRSISITAGRVEYERVLPHHAVAVARDVQQRICVPPDRRIDCIGVLHVFDDGRPRCQCGALALPPWAAGPENHFTASDGPK